MRRLMTFGVAVWLVASVALADKTKPLPPAKQMAAVIEAMAEPTNPPDGTKLPRFYMDDLGVHANPKEFPPVQGATPWETHARSTAIGNAAGGASGWISTDVEIKPMCIIPPCDKLKSSWMRATAVFEADTPWRPVAVILALPQDAKTQAELIRDKNFPPAIARAIEAGAEPVAKQFESTIGDPKAMIATVSARKEVVLYGSDAGERYAGGAAVKARLDKWNLTLKLRDGLAVGLTADKALAWVAANVDAGPAGKPTAPTQPYRVLFVYEQSGGAWQLVAAHFAVALTPQAP